MTVYNFGSLNIDITYRVPHMVAGGETLATLGRTQQAGGKGLNQSVALARAGAPVVHGGCVGTDGGFLRDLLAAEGADVSAVTTVEGPSGHAVIQVDDKGQNSILLYPGANFQLPEEALCARLAQAKPGDWLLLQNEVNGLEAYIRAAAAHGVKVALNPSPITNSLQALPLQLVDCFFLNEIEGATIAGCEDPAGMPEAMRAKFPNAQLVITLGGDGCMYWDGEALWRHPIFPVPVADTTGAGDTFTGYFLAGLIEGLEPAANLRRASAAAALAVSRPGAADAIPYQAEVEAFLAEKA